MRSFIAIELDDTIRNELAQVQAHLKSADADVKWVDRQNIHLTLKFLGEISEEEAKNVTAALDEVASKIRPFEFALSIVGAFPKPAFPRVIWVGIEKGKAESTELAKDIEEKLEQVGFPKEVRPFTPHLTIGRVRSSKNIKQLAEKLGAPNIERPLSQTAGSVILFKSDLTPSGPVYSKLHESRFK